MRSHGSQEKCEFCSVDILRSKIAQHQRGCTKNTDIKAFKCDICMFESAGLLYHPQGPQHPLLGRTMPKDKTKNAVGEYKKLLKYIFVWNNLFCVSPPCVYGLLF